MPTYEYECKKCDEIIEVKAGMNDELLEVCPCGKKVSTDGIEPS